jgi:hypothetical protein
MERIMENGFAFLRWARRYDTPVGLLRKGLHYVITTMANVSSRNLLDRWEHSNKFWALRYWWKRWQHNFLHSRALQLVNFWNFKYAGQIKGQNTTIIPWTSKSVDELFIVKMGVLVLVLVASDDGNIVYEEIMDRSKTRESAFLSLGQF